MYFRQGGENWMRDERLLSDQIVYSPAHYLGFNRQVQVDGVAVGNVFGNKIYSVLGPAPIVTSDASLKVLHDGIVRYLTLDEIRKANSHTDSHLVSYLHSLPFKQAVHAIADSIPAKTHAYLYETLFEVSRSFAHVSLHLQPDFLHHLSDQSPIHQSDFLLHASQVLLSNAPVEFRDWLCELTECLVANVEAQSDDLNIDKQLEDSDVPAAEFKPVQAPVHGDKLKSPLHTPTTQQTPQHRPGTEAHAQAVLRAKRWHKTHHKSAQKMREHLELFGSSSDLKPGDWQYMESCEACRRLQTNKPAKSLNDKWHWNEVHAPCQALAWDISYPGIEKVYGGLRYVSHFADVVSYHKWVFFLKKLTVDEVLAAILYIVNVVKLEFGMTVRVLLSDALSSFREKSKLLRLKLDLGIETSTFPRYAHHMIPAEAAISVKTLEELLLTYSNLSYITDCHLG